MAYRRLVWEQQASTPPPTPPPVESISLFTSQTPVSVFNDSDYELGTKFRATSAGSIVGFRFYKDAAETGVHVGKLWLPTDTSTPLVTKQFTGESASGWQTVALDSPYPLTPLVIYVVTCNLNTSYALTGALLAAPIVNGALETIADGGNGVYNETANSYPNSSFNNTCYFVDILFQGA